MTTRQATIHNQYGIHCRPAAIIAKQAQEYQGSVKITSGHGTVTNAKNIMGLISLGITCGQTITIEVEGPGEQEVADKMQELFEKSFDFTR